MGTLESIPKSDAAHYTAMGYPPDAKVGSDGLEHIFQTRLAGQVGGKLLAGKRVLASVKPVKAPRGAHDDQPRDGDRRRRGARRSVLRGSR